MQYPAMKHVGIGGSHIHDWRSAQSTSHPSPVMLTGEWESTCTTLFHKDLYFDRFLFGLRTELILS
jgi:hypothetical protein